MNASPVAPKKGMVFDHANWLRGNVPLRCVVTMLKYGCVYYKPIDGGKRMYTSEEDFPRRVKEIVA